jgi:hypothetical protein
MIRFKLEFENIYIIHLHVAYLFYFALHRKYNKKTPV